MPRFNRLIAVIVLTVPMFVWSLAGWATNPAPRAVFIAQNDGTEITDLLVPFAILSRAGINTEIVATQVGPVNLMSGLELLNLRTLADVDASAPDLIIVPALHHPNEANLLSWLSAAHSKGAIVASICDGVEVLAATGLLDGRRATGHFYSAGRRQTNHPLVNWVDDLRYVEEDRVFTTAGVSASAPASIRLVERLVGEATAIEAATYFGIERRNADQHDSSDFFVRFRHVATGLRNLLLGLRKKRYNLIVGEQVDEYSLALTVDALTRTFRSAVFINSPENRLRTRNGLEIRGNPSFARPHWQLYLDGDLPAKDHPTNTIAITKPENTLTTVFQHIAKEYGESTASLVRLQLELPNRGLSLQEDSTIE